MADGGSGAGEDEVVGHAGASERDVGFGFVDLLRGEAGVVAADGGEVGDLADVEAGCADDDVEGGKTRSGVWIPSALTLMMGVLVR